MNYLRRIGEIVLLTIFISSCTKEVSYYEEDIPEGSVILTSGTPQRVSENMVLKIVAIEDSRCPVGVVCSSPGEVNVKFEVFANGVINDFEMCYEQVKRHGKAEFEGHRINILDVSPFPFVENPNIDPMDYRIELIVEKE